jgi:GntR family transcriptional regulator, transcriptional repressor for pyruvate dehydrogenase complex
LQEFKKIKRATNLYEDVVNEIKKAILSGNYKTGEALPSETELARLLGVSRPVIREGIRVLQSRGFLEIRRGITGGAFVRELYQLPFMEDFADLIRYRRVKVDHLARARLLLEPEVCRLTAQNATPKMLKEMQDLLASYELIKERDKLDNLYSLFHRLVGRACGNPIYSIIMENIMDFTESFIRTMKPVTIIIHNESDHDEILEAFRQRDSEKAAEVGTRHAMDILREMKKLEDTYLELLGGKYPEDDENGQEDEKES